MTMWRQSLKVAILLALDTLAEAFSNSFSGAKQCEPVKLSWWTTSSDVGAMAGPPFQFIIVPIDSRATTDMIINIPDSAETWNGTSGEGGFYLPPIQLRAGSRFLTVMGDRNGFGTGGVSSIFTIGRSDDSSCLPDQSQSESRRHFQIPAPPRQCEDFTINWDPSIASEQIFIRGYVPLGRAFSLDPPMINATRSIWTVNVPYNTEFVLLFSKGGAQGLDVPLETSQLFKVEGTPNSRANCFIPNGPSSTLGMAKQTLITDEPSMSPTSTSSTTLPVSSSAVKTPYNNRVPTIIGSSTGTLAAVTLVLFVLFYFRWKKRNHLARTAMDLEITQPRPFIPPSLLLGLPPSGPESAGGQTSSQDSTNPLHPRGRRGPRLVVQNHHTSPAVRNWLRSSKQPRPTRGQADGIAVSSSPLEPPSPPNPTRPAPPEVLEIPRQEMPRPTTPPEIVRHHSDAGPVIIAEGTANPLAPRIIDLPPRYEDAARSMPPLLLIPHYLRNDHHSPNRNVE